jgi:hypothetical protein
MQNVIGAKHDLPARSDDWPLLVARLRDHPELSADECAFVRAHANEMISVMLIKNPYALAASLKRFMSDAPFQESLLTVSDYYRRSLSHIHATPKRWLIVRYEDLFADPGHTLALLSGEAVKIRDAVSEEVDKDGRRGKVFERHAYYLDQSYFDDLSEKELETVDRYVDWSVMREYGYEHRQEVMAS